MVFVFLFPTCLVTLTSGCVCVAADDMTLVPFLTEKYSTAYMDHVSLSLHLSVDISLSPWLVCYESCCYEHRGTCIFSNYSFVWIFA